MIYTPMTRRAMCLAYTAHQGQVDKCGVPYIFHPAHLAEQMDDEISCTVALLHDTVEDTAVTLEDLSREFPAEVVAAVALLTHADGTDYHEYVRRIKTNPIALKVKLADLAHNLDRTRATGSGIPEDKLAHWREKYEQAILVLQSN